MKRFTSVLVIVICLILVSSFTVVAQSNAVKEVREITGDVPEDLPDKITVGLSWNEKMQSLVYAWEDYMKAYSEEFAEEHGVEFEWIVNVADGDSAQQNRNIENLIARDVDVLITRPHDAAAIGAAIRSAKEANIPVLTFDRKSSEIDPSAHVGADSFEQAYTTGIAMANLLEEEGVEDAKAIELMGDLKDINAVNRSDGWAKAEKETGAWETVIQVPTEWDPEKFRTGTANALQAHPEANVLFIASDFAWDSVKLALEEAGRLEDMYIATQDLNPPGHKGMVNGYIDVGTTYDAYYHALAAVEVIAKLGAEQELDGKNYLIPGRVATKENVEEMDNMWAEDYSD